MCCRLTNKAEDPRSVSFLKNDFQILGLELNPFKSRPPLICFQSSRFFFWNSVLNLVKYTANVRNIRSQNHDISQVPFSRFSATYFETVTRVKVRKLGNMTRPSNNRCRGGEEKSMKKCRKWNEKVRKMWKCLRKFNSIIVSIIIIKISSFDCRRMEMLKEKKMTGMESHWG